MQITDRLFVSDDEIVQKAARASGPGGQHVNKTSTAIETRFDIANSPSLAEDVKARLIKLGGSRVTQDGVLVLFSEGSRSQQVNRQDGLDRLVDLIRQALVRPKVRRATTPTKASKERRLVGKAKRSGVKAMRKPPTGD